MAGNTPLQNDQSHNVIGVIGEKLAKVAGTAQLYPVGLVVGSVPERFLRQFSTAAKAQFHGETRLHARHIAID